MSVIQKAILILIYPRQDYVSVIQENSPIDSTETFLFLIMTSYFYHDAETVVELFKLIVIMRSSG